MPLHVLITGGAGFVGSHLADELLRHGHRVRALDDLSPQVHGEPQRRPGYLDPDVELLVGDVRDADTVRRALAGVDAVYHLAARVGVGQSMYEVAEYVSANAVGTATLLEQLARRPVGRLVVASSMSLYGEGLCRTERGEPFAPAPRSLDQLRRGVWEPLDDGGRPLEPVPTPESRPAQLESVYALTKYDQERLCLMMGRAYRIPTFALRLFNIYGPRQALSNPYTGVLAIFAARLLNGAPPLVYEDGRQRRDFVSVHDVARACRLALEVDVPPSEAEGQVLNVGSGEPRSVVEIAERMAETLGRPRLRPEITGRYRMGDIRHCFADIGAARRVLGYQPRVSFADGLRELGEWLRDQRPADRVGSAQAELESRGLTL